MSRALFSLATGLEIASGQATLEAVGRAKLASVLFDEVVLESGLHVVEMSTGELPFVRRQSAGRISPDLLEHSRTVERGCKAGLALRTCEDGLELYMGTDLPNLDDAAYVVRDVAFRYVSEYHSGLLDELARLKADWIKVIEIERSRTAEPVISDCSLEALADGSGGPEPFTVVRLDAEAASQLALQLQEAIERDAPDPGSQKSEEAAPHESMLAEDLREAITIGDRLNAVPAMSTAFERVASERGVSLRLPGAEGLGFMVPNFSGVPWDAIAQFRDHPGAVEARGKLREFESERATREQDASVARETGRAVSQALIGVTKDLAPRLPDEIRGPITASTIGLIPIVGQYASLAVSMGDVISALRRHEAYEGSWVAAIIELRDAAIETMIDW